MLEYTAAQLALAEDIDTDPDAWLLPGLFGAERAPQWPGVRAAYVLLHPACALCGATTTVEVHHKLPVHFPGGKELELIESNFVTLCRVHHFWVGHLGSWMARNPHIAEDVRTWRRKIAKRLYAA